MRNTHFVFEVAHGVPDDFTFYSVSMRDAADRVCIFRGDDDAKADSHVVSEERDTVVETMFALSEKTAAITEFTVMCPRNAARDRIN